MSANASSASRRRVSGETSPSAQLGQDGLVLRRPGDRRDVGEVLRGRAQHRRAADVDQLDAWLARPAGRDLLERVQVDADEVEGLDAVVGERGGVVLAVAAREDARVDARVERLHAAAEHLRRPRSATRPASTSSPCSSRKAAVPPEATSSTAERREPAREVVEPGLVVDGDQSPHSSLTTSGSSRCSTACTRCAQRLDGVVGRTGTRSAAITGPVSMPSST